MNPRSARRIATLFSLATSLSLAASASAQNVLIINGASGTSETGTTSSITTQLTNLHTAAGNIVTVLDAVPASLAGYLQVWDIRFSNNFGLTAATQTQYLNFLQSGGGMFVMGENSSFPSRNSSLLAFISQAGGGSLSFTTPGSTQKVLSPFTGPNAVSSLTYSAPGGVTGPGTGQCITIDALGNCTGVAWGVGTLANAMAGALTTIFDVNFMQTNASAQSQALTANLIGFVGQQVNPPAVVPEPTTVVLLGSGLLALGAMARRRRRPLA